MNRRHLLATVTALGLGPVAAQAPQAAVAGPASDHADALRRRGLVILLRHAATEPGIGDPPGYRLDDCRSQRNLSADGRAQAARMGRALAAQGLRPARVLASRWCRCQDTARLAFGQVEAWPALDSFFDAREREPAQTAALLVALGGLQPGAVVAWVTHMVNIAALTGDGVAMGEGLLLQPDRQPDGSLRVLRLGRIDTENRR